MVNFVKTLVAGALLFGSVSARAEKITAFWRLEPTKASGTITTPFNEPFFEQQILPVKLVRLLEPGISVNGTPQIAQGSFLYQVVNDSGKIGYCTIKDRSAKNQAATAFIPALDKRPCYVDRDGDGKFDASFSVFEAYTRLSPPQPRGSINAAKPLEGSIAYEEVAPTNFPNKMTISYKLLSWKSNATPKIQVTVERPGRSEYETVFCKMQDGVFGFGILGTIFTLRAIDDQRAEVQIQAPPEAYIYALNNGTVFSPTLPVSGAR